MKIALDEHIGEAIVEALKALSGDNKMLRVELVSARQYSNSVKQHSDVFWLEKYKADGGEIIISGDARMRSKLHEQTALRENGFVVFFPHRKWNQFKIYNKTAMLIRWWPFILEYAQKSGGGRFYELPMSWSATTMKEVTPPPRKKPGRKKEKDDESGAES